MAPMTSIPHMEKGQGADMTFRGCGIFVGVETTGEESGGINGNIEEVEAGNSMSS